MAHPRITKFAVYVVEVGRIPNHLVNIGRKRTRVFRYSLEVFRFDSPLIQVISNTRSPQDLVNFRHALRIWTPFIRDL